MPSVAVNGVELYYEEAGAGDPIVFSHEFAGCLHSWEPQLRYFARRYRAIAYNHRGFPPSSVPDDPGAYSEELLVEDLHGLLDALGLHRAHIVGCSMGGSVALEFAIAHQERCRGVVIVGAGAGTTNREQFEQDVARTSQAFLVEGMEGVARFYLHTPNRTQFLAKDPRGWQELRDNFVRQSATGHAHTMRGVQLRRRTIYEAGHAMPGITAPVLIVVGDEDEPCLEPALFMKRRIPNAGLLVLPKSGHAVNLEEPALFNQLVSEFLADVEHGTWRPRAEVSTSMVARGERVANG